MAKKINYYHLFKIFGIQKEDFVHGLYKYEIIVFLLVLACFDNMEVVTKKDIVRINKSIPEQSTYSSLRQLQEKGYIDSIRSNRYYSPSYISLTPKGLLLKRSLGKYLSSPLP